MKVVVGGGGGSWRAGVAKVELVVLRLRPDLGLEVLDAPDHHVGLLAAVLPRGPVVAVCIHGAQASRGVVLEATLHNIALNGNCNEDELHPSEAWPLAGRREAVGGVKEHDTPRRRNEARELDFEPDLASAWCQSRACTQALMAAL